MAHQTPVVGGLLQPALRIRHIGLVGRTSLRSPLVLHVHETDHVFLLGGLPRTEASDVSKKGQG
jgi:hypothetical protein